MKRIFKNLSGLYLALKKDNYNFYLSKKKIKKVRKNFPVWMKTQIEEECKCFKDKKNDINKTIENLKRCDLLKSAELIRVKILNNQIEYQNFLSVKYHPRFVRFHNFFKKALEYIDCPNIDFLYSIHDSFDDPKWLKCLKVPVFCISKLRGNNRVVLFPHIEWMQRNDGLFSSICKMNLQLPWNKRVNKAFWRGSTTGFQDLDKNERFKLTKLAKQYPDFFDVYFSKITPAFKKDNKIMKKYLINKKYSPHEQLKYKYLLSIDGNAFPGSFFWQLFSKSTVLKNKSDFLEWYYKGLVRNEHYIEYDNEKDLLEKLIKLNKCDCLAERISKKANKFAYEYLSNESIVVYIYKLFERFHLLNII